jgi:hypothetical protein
LGSRIVAGPSSVGQGVSVAASNLPAVSGRSAAEIIDAFMTRASRVINSELVDATKAQLEEGYTVNIRMFKDGGYEARYLARNEYYLKGLSADLRPFLPWVDDITKLSRVINAVMRSLTNDNWKRSLIWFQNEYKKLLDDHMCYSYWSIPHEQWQMGMSDIELAKTVLNQQWFHEGIDPRIRHILESDTQQMANYQAVSRLLNNTILCVVLLQRFITDADDAGVLHPKTN